MIRPILVAALALAGAAAPAVAATVAFSGSRANLNLLNPPGTGRCAPLNTVNIAPGALSSTGTSNFGAFASTQSHCIPGAPTPITPVQPVSDGIFQYTFDRGDTLFGTYTGTATLANGVITGIENFIVSGGTGRFADATGTFSTTGTLGFIPNPGGPGFVGSYNGTIAGILNLPAVPEPATWGLMIGGFALVGATARRQRHVQRQTPTAC